jgi:hypothetical protein
MLLNVLPPIAPVKNVAKKQIKSKKLINAFDFGDIGLNLLE